MNSLDNFEPFDDLEGWSDNIDLFMDAMANPPQHADALWELAKLKKEKAKAPEQSSESIFDKPWIKRECPLCRDGHPASRSPKAHIFKKSVA